MDVQVTSPNGRIEIVTGCMFSGKTQELIHRSQRAEISGKNVLGFKPEIDDRYNKDKISSHTGVKIDAVTINSEDDVCEQVMDFVSQYEQQNDNIDVIMIDEVNLFSDEIITAVDKLAKNSYRVILSGLDQNFRGEPFDPVPDLMAIADHIEKRKAVCEECGEPATKTQKLIDGKPASYDDPTIDVGGDEKYEPRCRDCHSVHK